MNFIKFTVFFLSCCLFYNFFASEEPVQKSYTENARIWFKESKKNNPLFHKYLFKASKILYSGTTITIALKTAVYALWTIKEIFSQKRNNMESDEEQEQRVWNKFNHMISGLFITLFLIHGWLYFYGEDILQ